jgi:hypothetical protein
MAALTRGDSPAVIVRDHHVSLDELERIRDKFLRMADARLIEAPTVRLICEALETPKFDAAEVVVALRALRQIRRLMDVGTADHSTLVAAVQALLERHSKLVAERRASDTVSIIRPIGVDQVDGPTSNNKSSRTGGRG